MSETKDDMVEGEKATEPGQNVTKLSNPEISNGGGECALSLNMKLIIKSSVDELWIRFL